jgi:hypothetical protein
MWGEFCEEYSPNAERIRELKEMDSKTLDTIYEKLDNQLNFLKDHRKESKCIDGMELACQIIFGLIADKKYYKEDKE